jgi:hypothetical protein
VAVYLAARNEQLRTRHDHPVDWAAAWQTGAVTEDEWSALVVALRAEYEQQLAYVRIIEEWDEAMIADAFALLGHCAYHLGEIRQGLGLLRR